jgi:hypothetical protein
VAEATQTETGAVLTKPEEAVPEIKLVVSESEGAVAETEATVSETEAATTETEAAVSELLGVVSEPEAVAHEPKEAVIQTVAAEPEAATACPVRVAEEVIDVHGGEVVHQSAPEEVVSMLDEEKSNSCVIALLDEKGESGETHRNFTLLNTTESTVDKLRDQIVAFEAATVENEVVQVGDKVEDSKDSELSIAKQAPVPAVDDTFIVEAVQPVIAEKQEDSEQQPKEVSPTTQQLFQGAQC